MTAVLALFAHPDDEAFRCGGTLALLAQRGVRVHVLTATRGQAGSCGEPPLCQPDKLGVVREAELHCACQALGIEPPHLLDYQDGTLAQVEEKQAIAEIMAVLRELEPQVLLTWPSHGLSGHSDHIAVSNWATAAYQRAIEEGLGELAAIYYMAVPHSVANKLGLRQLHALPDKEVSLVVDVNNVWEQKLAAIRCHRTQLGESPILRAPIERQKLFLGVEHFQRVMAHHSYDVLLDLHQR